MKHSLIECNIRVEDRYNECDGKIYVVESYEMGGSEDTLFVTLVDTNDCDNEKFIVFYFLKESLLESLEANGYELL